MPLFVAVRYSVACRRPHFCYDKSKQNHLWHRTRCLTASSLRPAWLRRSAGKQHCCLKSPPHPCLTQLHHSIPAKTKCLDSLAISQSNNHHPHSNTHPSYNSPQVTPNTTPPPPFLRVEQYGASEHDLVLAP